MSLARLSTIIVDQFYFVRSPLSRKIKTKLFLNYIRLGFKRLFLRREVNESFLGLKYFSRDYSQTVSLFDLIFYRAQYVFDTDSKKPLILDCGANLGAATLFFKWKYGSAEIHCFEPNPDIFKILKKNVTQNKFENVFLNNIALGSKNGRMDFYINESDDAGLTSSLKSGFANNNHAKKITVKAIKLSKYINENLKQRKIDMIKFNIEGAENDVLNDLYDNKLLRNINNMVFEYHHLQSDKSHSELGPFLAKLEEYGFEYNLSVNNFGLYEKFNPQNVFIYAYRRKQLK